MLLTHPQKHTLSAVVDVAFPAACGGRLLGITLWGRPMPTLVFSSSHFPPHPSIFLSFLLSFSPFQLKRLWTAVSFPDPIEKKQMCHCAQFQSQNVPRNRLPVGVLFVTCNFYHSVWTYKMPLCVKVKSDAEKQKLAHSTVAKISMN